MPGSPSDSHSRYKRRKSRIAKNAKRNRSGGEEEDEEEEEENEVTVEADEDEDLHPNPNPNPYPRNREPELISGSGFRISDFPVAVRYEVNRHHSSVLAIAAAGQGQGQAVVLENLSHGQLQVLSAVPADSLALVDQDTPLVITPPPIMEGRGVIKTFWNRLHVLPFHADWFQPTTVHRLERQVVPHFFSAKSAHLTPHTYLDSRNVILSKYMENPAKRLSLQDCQHFLPALHLDDLTRIFRFLDHWGIINYSASPPPHQSWTLDAYLREDPNGEVHVPSAILKSIDSLIKFDLPKCTFKSFDVPSLPHDTSDLDTRIREILSETHCSFCSRPLFLGYYQSVKEADTLLCSDCYHEGRLIIGHSSLDFTKFDPMKDYGDQDSDNWTDQETLLLLEALEIYNDSWNEIAEHVGTKSKAQCILHFLRMPVEDGLLEKIEVPSSSCLTNGSIKENHSRSYQNENGPQGHDSENSFPFVNSENPVMALVAFLTSSMGPRVAAACAHASLAALSEDDGLLHGNRMDSDDGPVEIGNSSQQKGIVNPDAASLSDEKVNIAAKVGLASAAMKAKLFADHEEREIQRLSANIINHQLKRLELKLKQFAEVETLLMKECEQVEKTRQRLAGERARALTTRFGPSGAASPMNLSSVASQVNNISTSRQPIISASPSQPSVSGYGNSQMNHPHMSILQHQQMFSFGPRLPLSAIQPSSSGLPSSVMFDAHGSSQSSTLSHQMLRPIPGTSSGMG